MDKFTSFYPSGLHKYCNWNGTEKMTVELKDDLKFVLKMQNNNDQKYIEGDNDNNNLDDCIVGEQNIIDKDLNEWTGECIPKDRIFDHDGPGGTFNPEWAFSFIKPQGSGTYVEYVVKNLPK